MQENELIIYQPTKRLEAKELLPGRTDTTVTIHTVLENPSGKELLQTMPMNLAVYYPEVVRALPVLLVHGFGERADSKNNPLSHHTAVAMMDLGIPTVVPYEVLDTSLPVSSIYGNPDFGRTLTTTGLAVAQLAGETADIFGSQVNLASHSGGAYASYFANFPHGQIANWLWVSPAINPVQQQLVARMFKKNGEFNEQGISWFSNKLANNARTYVGPSYWKEVMQILNDINGLHARVHQTGANIKILSPTGDSFLPSGDRKVLGQIFEERNISNIAVQGTRFKAHNFLGSNGSDRDLLVNSLANTLIY